MSFSQPEMFVLAALIPLMITAALLATRSRGRAWKRLVAERLRGVLVRAGSSVPRWVSFGLALLGFLCVIASLAGPNAGYEERTETIRGRNLLLAIDISRSMLAEDESPNRLAAALAAAYEVIDQFPNDRIGVIAFSGSAFLQAPLTIDHPAIRETLQQLDPITLAELDAEFLPRGGSDISQAVQLAVDTFKETGQRNNALIIFTDGESHVGGIEDAADAADEEGVTIFTAGFGSQDGAFIPDPNQNDGRLRDRKGNLVFTQLQTDGLRLLARRTGGFHTQGSGRYFADNLETAVAQLDRFEFEGRKRRVAIPRFQWFLFPAIVFFIASILVSTPWRLGRKPLAAALAFFCLLPDAEARLLPATPAEQALAAGRHEEALARFRDEIRRSSGERRARLQLGAGTAAYRLGDYPLAAESYSEALLSEDRTVRQEAHYALGNTLFYRGYAPMRQGDAEPSTEAVEDALAIWPDALAHYQDTLAINPGHQEAADNYKRVRELLEELKKQQQKQQKEQNDQENQDQNQESQGNEDQNEDQQDPENTGNQNQDPDQQNPNPDGTQDPDNGDPQANPDQQENGPEDQASTPEPSPGEQEQQLQPRPDETPEEYARRVLAENADFQTTPLMRRRMQQRRPEKDW